MKFEFFTDSTKNLKLFLNYSI